MHKLTDDRMKWGWAAVLLGVVLGGANVWIGSVPRAVPHPVRTQAEAFRVVERRLHRRVCATHCYSGPIGGMWFVALWNDDRPHAKADHRWAAVEAETGRVIPRISMCTYGWGDAPRVCRPADSEVEIRPGPGMTRAQFKQVLKELE